MPWRFDPAHSSIEFSAKHMMITTVRGRFKQWSGTIEFDEAHPEATRVTVEIEAASLDSDQPQRDAHLKSADFLDVEHYPTITFSSTRAEALSDTTGKLYGDLTIRGVTRPVVLDVTLEGRSRDWQGKRRLGFTATTSLNRKDWGLNWNVALEAGGWLVSERIDVHIEAQLIEEESAASQESQTQAAGRQG
ncbi:MAG: YceI family protein [Thermogemmatispora sp.]|uniref:YceI family protein n=1 Tax=Thermogemmatispora sp. TaxID=1968838 RepID=UPI00261833A0|nr:YceI family protein [Thermogemmatispora sp.]MBX5458715.1 YceI family protein [Thermogemmatispora sp.]